MRRLVALLLLLATACSSGSPTADVITSPSPEKDVLLAGKGDVALTPGTHYSPVDFVPPLTLGVPAGWTSTRRGDDAFDLRNGDVVVVLDTPAGDTVAPALADLRAKVPHPVPVTGTLDGRPATGFDAVGGTGQLLASPGGTLSLDLAPAQRVRVLGTDVDGVPLLAVVLVPDGRKWAAALPQALDLLKAVTPG